MKLVTSAQMRQVDRESIDNRKIPGEQLMENAGRGIAIAILDEVITSPSQSSVAVLCGKGNNGGDGFVVARYLHQAGVHADVYFIGPIQSLSEDARLNFDRAAGADVDLHELRTAGDLPEDTACDFVIDAVFGTGFTGEPQGLAADIIEYINRQDAQIIAVDLPSGLNADTGRYEGAVVQADYTFTLALPKYGLYVSPGRELAGRVKVIPIGVPDDVIDGFDLNNELITEEWVTERLPVRKPDGHKGDFGRLLVLAGSTGMTGAASMAALSALRAGCGLVKVGCPQSVQPVLAVKLTEAMTHPLPDVARRGKLALRGLGEIRKLLDENDAVVIGPGIGRNHQTFELIRRLVAKLDKPAIIDADGLNALAGHTEAIKECPSMPVLTPHPGEFARLVGSTVPEDIQERAELVRTVATELDVVLVLKGSPTLVAAPGECCYLNPTGNHGMASGGSGDVLSGIIGSFLAQGMDPLDAAVAGVYVHGLAGDFAADIVTPRSMIPGDMIETLPEVFEVLE
ncbi:MAG TPA: NAD(P)H-hydrate dehydratase [Acidobacteriota bacterium]|nr:NAD(P)H-hydrate dehydratase [Acidobacteriota bacterium]